MNESNMAELAHLALTKAGNATEAAELLTLLGRLLGPTPDTKVSVAKQEAHDDALVKVMAKEAKEMLLKVKPIRHGLTGIDVVDDNTTREHKMWTLEEKAHAEYLFDLGKRHSYIARVMKRSVQGIYGALSRGIVKPTTYQKNMAMSDYFLMAKLEKEERSKSLKGKG